jgi:alkylation response protein AidB-like acyl-CoA dehydrogenase
MQFELSDEQRAFRDSCSRLAADLAASWHRGRGPHDVDQPTPDELAWSRIVDAGWLGIGLREANGGAGATAADLAVLVEQLGYHAVAAPVVGTIIAAEQLQTWNAPAALLEEVATGGVRVAPALSPDLRAFATATAGAIAWDAAGATLCVLPGAGAAFGLGDPIDYADLTRAARRLADPVEAPDLTRPDAAAQARLHAFALTLLTADLLGVAQAALDAALAHAQARSQFGALIGSFQAVQQLLADSHVLVEATRSAAAYSAWAVDARAGAEALRAARSAKAFASRSAVEVCEHAIQVFGGIGMTWEAPAHIWLRRTHGDRAVLGDEHHHQAAIAAAGYGS